MPKQKPQPQMHGLAEGLKRARKGCKLSMVEVADQLDWSQSTLSRIENGLRNVSVEEVVALCTIYRLPAPQRRRFTAMARDVDRPAWLEIGLAEGEMSMQAITLVQHEKQVTRLRTVETIFVPGLLQTRAYMVALLIESGIDAAVARARAEVRLNRQRIIDSANPPRLTAFIDEAALHRRIGGRSVMAAQLRHLTAKARSLPHIELRLIPFCVGGHPAVGHAYWLLEFPDAQPLVHVEHRFFSLYLHEPSDVNPYVAITDELEAVALDHLQTLHKIDVIAARFEQDA